MTDLGLRLMHGAGATDINAFRAGNFGFNADTLSALATNGIPFDSSYNASQFDLNSEVMLCTIVIEPVQWIDTCEYPITVFNGGTSSLRHTQLSGGSFPEMEVLLWKALEGGQTTFNIRSHNFELHNRARGRPDEIVIQLFHKRWVFLDKIATLFACRGFRRSSPQPTVPTQPTALASRVMRNAVRLLEHAYGQMFA